MPISEYVASLRARIGNDLLQLPGITAVIRRGDQFLLCRANGLQTWGFIGGGVEPAEDPVEAVAREVQEELGARVQVGAVLGAYGGPELVLTYANGDRVAYVTTAYECELLDEAVVDQEEVSEVRWFSAAEIDSLEREPWVDRILHDAIRRG